MPDPVELSGVLPSGKLYKGTVHRDRIDLIIEGVHYWIWAGHGRITAGWSIND